jgi:hypothetical protein
MAQIESFAPGETVLTRPCFDAAFCDDTTIGFAPTGLCLRLPSLIERLEEAHNRLLGDKSRPLEGLVAKG